jgi:hypothetical protein
MFDINKSFKISLSMLLSKPEKKSISVSGQNEMIKAYQSKQNK